MNNLPASLSLRKWHPGTWGVFTLWLLFALVANNPFVPAPKAEWDAYGASAMTGANPYHMVIEVGWPMTWLEIEYPPGALKGRKQYYFAACFLNLTLIMITQLSVVYVMQRRRRFSMRAVLLAVLVVAIAVTTGKMFASLRSGFYLPHYVMVIYFLPAAVSAAMFALRSAPDRS